MRTAQLARIYPSAVRTNLTEHQIRESRQDMGYRRGAVERACFKVHARQAGMHYLISESGYVCTTSSCDLERLAGVGMGAVRRPVVRACECECKVRVAWESEKKKWGTRMKFRGEVVVEEGRGDAMGWGKGGGGKTNK